MKSAVFPPHAVLRPRNSQRRPWWSRWLIRLLRWATSRAAIAPVVPVAPATMAQAPKPAAAPQARVPNPAAAPAARSVPVPIDALTQLLNMHPMARVRLRHLALVESSCHLSPGDPFGRLPPRVIEIAVRQLDAVLPRHPALRVLRLQLERHLQAHRARIAAVLAAEDPKWQLETAVTTTGTGLAPDSMIGGPWGVTDFLETLPFDRMRSAAVADRPAPAAAPP